MERNFPIRKQSGITKSERYLFKLCHKSFLSLWSYANIYRDQGKSSSGDGKEVCDVFVVFGNDVIIFSDKNCKFPDSGKIDMDWSRWYRRAIQEGAKQLWGAERWIREFPERIFINPCCTERLPIDLVSISDLRIHRIVVAHNASRRCQAILGGTGSLLICPGVKGRAHYDSGCKIPLENTDSFRCLFNLNKVEPWSLDVIPFAVGDVDPTQGFIHVFDDTGLEVVLGELDTISDFIPYLIAREKFIRSGLLLVAGGEDDLLAHYVQGVNEFGVGSFHAPKDHECRVIVPEGEWVLLQRDSEWLERKQVTEISYVWDRMVEKFNCAILTGLSPVYPLVGLQEQELAVRALASEDRRGRRLLSEVMIDFLKINQSAAIFARLVRPVSAGRPYYIFLQVRPGQDDSYPEYRSERYSIAFAYLIECKRRFPDQECIVIATEPSDWSRWRSEDVFYHGKESPSPFALDLVREFVVKQGILISLDGAVSRGCKISRFRRKPPNPAFANAKVRRTGRNELCPCGSGMKYKRCCIRM
jgi:uncharacterized protein YchJ